MVIRRNEYRGYKEYFCEIPEFSLLPERYQERIILFFLEDRHYMVDVADVATFLRGGKDFLALDTYQDLVDLNASMPVKRVLGFKMYFETLKELTDWMNKVSDIDAQDGYFAVFMAHSFDFWVDEPEEWYIASY